jgi:cob(I)alamin adenosyltransferase
MTFESKPGDKGTTKTLSNETISKGDQLIECQGQVDELSCLIDNLRLNLLETKISGTIFKETTIFLSWLIEKNFIIGQETSSLGNLENSNKIETKHIEEVIGKTLLLKQYTELPKGFVYERANLLASECNILRTKVRSVERAFARLKKQKSSFDLQNILTFLNRLGEYFFILTQIIDNTNSLFYIKKS